MNIAKDTLNIHEDCKIVSAIRGSVLSLNGYIDTCEGFSKIFEKRDLEISFSALDKKSGKSFSFQINDDACLGIVSNRKDLSTYEIKMATSYFVAHMDEGKGRICNNVECPVQDRDECTLKVLKVLAKKLSGIK